MRKESQTVHCQFQQDDSITQCLGLACPLSACLLPIDPGIELSCKFGPGSWMCTKLHKSCNA